MNKDTKGEPDKNESAEILKKYGLRLKPQKIPTNHPNSRYFFTTQPVVATRSALDAYGEEIISKCLVYLQKRARLCNGLDYLQVFEDVSDKRPPLWFIDDGEGGATTALLPEDY